MKRARSFPHYASPVLGAVATVLLLAVAAGPVLADGGVTFSDIAASSGVTYERTPSPRKAIRDQVFQFVLPFPSAFLVARANTPMKARGAPGLALLDYDNDGDLDIYITNGPGTPNSLLSNQLRQSHQMTFVDVGVAAGVDATAQDSSGVCFGDIDNDGDEDLYVVGTGQPNILFENNGNGTFSDITTSSGAGGPTPGRYGIACTMADFDNNGLLDIAVGNTYRGCPNPVNPFTGQQYPCNFAGMAGDPNFPPQSSWEHRLPVFSSAFATYPLMEHNVLLLNQGGNQFADASATSGIENVSFMSGPGLTGAAFTWAIASYDWDLDGDVDIHTADNQGSAANNAGLSRIFDNDGSGNFTDITQSLGLDGSRGSWMGLSAGDFNCDGRLDFFTTDVGVYLGNGAPQDTSSRWFIQQPDGTFLDDGQGMALGTPFGWGTSTLDYDNDGDTDVVYQGGVDFFSLVVADNPTGLMRNDGDCSGQFSWDVGAINNDHRFRVDHGVAVGDVNNDGFTDLFSVSSFNIVPGHPAFVGYANNTGPKGVFDPFAAFQGILQGVNIPNIGTAFVPIDPQPTLPNGTLAIDLNSADNGNNWAKFRTLGSAGILSEGSVNRDGIGATVFFTPEGGNTTMMPVMGGSSYASQDALEKVFGLGSAAEGTVEVLWPGGDRNKLYRVKAGERVTLPHIPCSYDTTDHFVRYYSCVSRNVNSYWLQGYISFTDRIRLTWSAVLAYLEHRSPRP